MHVDLLRKTTFLLLLAACLTPWVGATVALVMGIGISLLWGNPWPNQTARYSKNLLQCSVVGLGFGLGLGEVLQTGKDSLWYSVIGIACTLVLGYLLGRLFRTDRNTSALISFGTAICGGSAIAALAPVLKAKNEETAVSLATIFTLNAVALLLFPLVGRWLQLDQHTFGIWAGLAIHDTSSVVGAAAAYGQQALSVGTTVKLTRAIWIAPLAMAAALVLGGEKKLRIPLFIIGFLAAAAVRTALPSYAPLWQLLATLAKQCLVVTLFLVGSGLSREVLQRVGLRPLLQAVTLWVLVSALTLGALELFGLL